MLEIRDQETNNRVLDVLIIEGEKQYPFEFRFEKGEVWLSESEVKLLYHFLEEVFYPKIENE